eukprot:g2233.t1
MFHIGKNYKFNRRKEGDNVLKVGSMKVEVISGTFDKNLSQNADMFGYVDPYITITHCKSKKSTKYKSNTLKPKWREVFDIPSFVFASEGTSFDISAWDHDDLSSDDYLGERTINFSTKDFHKLEKGNPITRTAKLFNKRYEKKLGSPKKNNPVSLFSRNKGVATIKIRVVWVEKATVTGLDSHKVTDLINLFKELDANGDGKLDVAEFVNLCQVMTGSTSEERTRIHLKRADLDNDDQLDIVEWLLFSQRLSSVSKSCWDDTIQRYLKSIRLLRESQNMHHVPTLSSVACVGQKALNSFHLPWMIKVSRRLKPKPKDNSSTRTSPAPSF